MRFGEGVKLDALAAARFCVVSVSTGSYLEVYIVSRQDKMGNPTDVEGKRLTLRGSSSPRGWSGSSRPVRRESSPSVPRMAQASDHRLTYRPSCHRKEHTPHRVR